jgi:uncharacterized membrane protein
MKQFLKKIFYLIFFCLIILSIRIYIQNSTSYLFLAWNLLLATIPLLISVYLKRHNSNLSKLKLIPFFAVWLLFLPNCPYIMTDFVHFFKSNSKTMWLDLLLLFSFAFSGLLFGLISINQILEIIHQKWSRKISNTLLFGICFSCGFGIYLGRVLRFNSWDIITSPISILEKSLSSYSSSTAWLMTLGFGGFLYVAVKSYSFSSVKPEYLSSIP